MLIFPFIEDGFVFFYLKKGYFLNYKKKKKVFTVTAAVCELKGRFTFFERSDYTGSFSIF